MVKRYLYDSHLQLCAHLINLMDAYNFPRRLNSLKGLRPHEDKCNIRTSESGRFTINPINQMPGLKT